MEKVFSRVLIKDEDHHMLVIQDRANISNFPGGKQELGETPVECAKREIQEEIGLSIHQLTEVFQGDFYFGHTKWKGYFYFAESVSGIPSMNEMDKIKGIRFVNSKEKINFPIELSAAIETVLTSNLVHDKITKWI